MKERKPIFIDHLAKFTTPQQSALKRIFEQHVRDTDHPDFKNMGFVDWVQQECTPQHFDECVMVSVPNMFIGIERDGYAHT